MASKPGGKFCLKSKVQPQVVIVSCHSPTGRVLIEPKLNKNEITMTNQKYVHEIVVLGTVCLCVTDLTIITKMR